jgi:hypothetical protein
MWKLPADVRRRYFEFGENHPAYVLLCVQLARLYSKWIFYMYITSRRVGVGYTEGLIFLLYLLRVLFLETEGALSILCFLFSLDSFLWSVL